MAKNFKNYGNVTKTATIPSFHSSDLMDYITLEVVHPTVPIPILITTPFKRTTHINMLIALNKQEEIKKKPQQEIKEDQNPIQTGYTFTTKVLVMSQSFPPKVNLTFTKHEDTDWKILHRRFNHIADKKLATMCQKQLLEELQEKYPIKRAMS